MSKTISLQGQIDEVAGELTRRAANYPREVRAGKMKQAEADYRMERLRAALASLRFVQRHQALITTAVQAVVRAGEAEAREETI